MLGVAYKKDVDDLRESPIAEDYAVLLQKRGADFDYNDPYFPEIPKLRHYNFPNKRSALRAPRASRATIAC